MYMVFNDKDSRTRFLDEVPADLVQHVEEDGDRELAINPEKLDDVLAVLTDEDYVIEERG